MDLRIFNLMFLTELNRYRRDLRHLGTGSEYHPLLRSVLLTEVKQDLEMDGFEVAYERWRLFVRGPQLKPLNLPPSPVYGQQLSFTGGTKGGQTIRLPLQLNERGTI